MVKNFEAESEPVENPWVIVSSNHKFGNKAVSQIERLLMSLKSGPLCALKFAIKKNHQFFITSCTSLLSNWAEISRRFDALERRCFDPRPNAGRWTLSSFSSIPMMSPNSSSKLSFQKLKMIKIYFSKFYWSEKVLSSLLSDLFIYLDFKET